MSKTGKSDAGTVQKVNEYLPQDALTQAEYARYRGVTPGAINRHVKSGKIPLLSNGKIEPKVADRILGPVRASGDLSEAKLLNEQIKAQRAQIELDRELRNLLDAEDVRVAMERCAEIMARDIDQLSSHTEELWGYARENGLQSFRAKMKDLSRQLRQTMADNLTLEVGEEVD